MTPFSNAQLRRKAGDERRRETHDQRARRLNRYISRYRIQVELRIAEKLSMHWFPLAASETVPVANGLLQK